MEDILKRYQGNIDNICDEDGNSLLIMATIKGDYKMVDILLQRGVDVNGQNNIGNTALHYAIMKRFNKTID
jgi:ankyrin repeat protein